MKSAVRRLAENGRGEESGQTASVNGGGRKAAPAKHGDIRIGISGWRYKPWRGVFYPKGLPQNQELTFASHTFRSIEINGTHYRLQKPEFFEHWASDTPDDFVFAVKAHRYITHMRRLKDSAEPLARFFGSGLLRLGPKLGPILWQLPPNFRFDPERIENFFKLLPRDTGTAAELVRRHKRGRRPKTPPAPQHLRHAMEIRHQSFVDPKFIELLRAYDVALVCADTVEWPRLMDVTADFIYCRLHGSEVLYTSGYDAKAIRRWSERAVAWARGEEPADAERVIDRPAPRRVRRDVYVYFDNDAKVRAPYDAQQMMACVAALVDGRGA
jgi:uncharacterized protein YecE (DUF72 family)